MGLTFYVLVFEAAAAAAAITSRRPLLARERACGLQSWSLYGATESHDE